MFPLALARDFADWRDEVLEKREDLDEDERRRLGSYLNQVDKSIANPIRMYQFPVTTLSEETPTEAVCTIFETLNRTGVKLSVFELICARAFAEGERLRERWKDATSNHQILDDFVIDPYYLLQAIALRVGKKPQRGVVAGLDVATIVQEWDAAVLGMVKGLKMLREECGVLTLRLLPYAPMLPTLAASWGLVDGATGPAQGARRRKLQQWFWCASFAGDYDNAPNSRAEADMPLLKKWLEDGEAHPVVANFTFEPSTWSSVTPRQRGLYRSTMALLMRHHPLDFHLTQPLTKATIDAGAVDDHHIFPRKYLEELGLAGRPDSILNHTLIDKVTNIRIGKKAPSVYLSEMEVELKGTLDQVLTSHGLPSAKDGPLWRDDYDGFLEWRLGHLTSELESVSQGGS